MQQKNKIYLDSIKCQHKKRDGKNEEKKHIVECDLNEHIS